METDPEQAVKGEGPPQKRILIVDDEEQIRYFLGLDLSGKGYIVDTAENGEEAIQKLDSENPPDLVLLDLNMPGIDGYGVLSRMDKLKIKPPVLIFSTQGDTITRNNKRMGLGEFRGEYPEANVQGILKKPDDVGEIPRIVHETLENP